MHELKLNITDNVFKQFMEFIEILPKGSIEIKELSNCDSDSDPFFNERKEMIQQRIQDIDNGKLTTQNFDEFEAEMNDFEKKLELKYGHQ